MTASLILTLLVILTGLAVSELICRTLYEVRDGTPDRQDQQSQQDQPED